MHRRTLIKAGIATGVASLLPLRGLGEVRGRERIRVGLVGCGGRGSGNAAEILAADPAVEIVAVADLFPDQVKAGLTRIKRRAKDRFDPTKVTTFSGWDAAAKLIGSGIDIVLLAETPAFRPQHLELALKAGKHVFAEKPVCVDAVGTRKIYELAKLADDRKLSVMVGTQSRHHTGFQEAIKRVHDGQIGDIVAAECHYYYGSFVGSHLLTPNTADPAELEYQIRNWKCFIWGSGDHIVEQHIHCQDIINWALDKVPLTATGVGGRAVTLPVPKYGNRFSHFANHYDFGDGVICSSICRQEPKTSVGQGGRIVGTKGMLNFVLLGRTRITGEKPWQANGSNGNPVVNQQKALIQSIRDGRPVNALHAIAGSCLTTIAGRMSAYSGRRLKLSWVKDHSRESLLPEKQRFGNVPIRPLPVPGTYKLI